MWKQLDYFFNEEIWKSEYLELKDAKGWWYGFFRILVIIVRGVDQNRVFSEAASLAYASLIALGPFLAVMVMAVSFIFKGENVMDLFSQFLEKAIVFATPAAAEFLKAEATTEHIQGLNPLIVKFISNLSESARSGAAGLIGTVLFVGILLQQIISLEGSFNTIWGVQQGRSWGQRFVVYWAALSLFILTVVTGVGIFSAVSIVSIVHSITSSLAIETSILQMLPFLSYAFLALILSAFYFFMPNTHVKWKPAFIGGVLVAILLFVNNYLSFLYVGKAIQTQSLYGSIGIIPVLMFGLYIFWLFIVVGGVITYSVQNAEFLSYQRIWHNTSTFMRELLSFSTLVLIARRFQKCQPPITLDELSSLIKVPGHLLNASLEWLIKEKWVSAVEYINDEGMSNIGYQPARPLTTISLSGFKRAFDNYGNSAGVQSLQELDPIIAFYSKQWNAEDQGPGSRKSLHELLEAFPVKE